MQDLQNGWANHARAAKLNTEAGRPHVIYHVSTLALDAGLAATFDEDVAFESWELVHELTEAELLAQMPAEMNGNPGTYAVTKIPQGSFRVWRERPAVH